MATTTDRHCPIAGCPNEAWTHGMCNAHWRRIHKYGSPLAHKPLKRADNRAERFWAQVDRTGECWEWTGIRHIAGYGWLGKDLAHRFSWEHHFGAIPDGLFVCHHCDNRRCVRPDHLFLGTHADNMADMSRKGRTAKPMLARTHCPHGHTYAGDNLLVSKDGRRSCRTCRRAQWTAYHRKTRGPLKRSAS